jgi:hypothetical protein
MIRYPAGVMSNILLLKPELDVHLIIDDSLCVRGAPNRLVVLENTAPADGYRG